MKRLVTEADVRRMARGARIVVDRDTLVTPAARDCALLAGIEVVETAAARKPTGSCCDRCAAGGTCSCADVPKLGDGDWLVQVRAGRVTARRVGP